MIELRGVSKRFGDQVAVAPLDLAVPSGRTTILIGPSGCGKSTILRMLAGLVEPSTGAILFDGEPLDAATLMARRRRLGYVVQDGGLFPHLTARDNVDLMARQLKKPKVEIDARVAELAELTRFPADGLDRYPVQLSGGQRQRVSLMRALMLKPDTLLLDEPLGALDPMVRAGLQADLKAIFKTLGQTVLFVTHDMGEAGYLGDEIALMRDGRLVQVGAPEDFRARPAEPFVTEFLNAQRSLAPA